MPNFKSSLFQTHPTHYIPLSCILHLKRKTSQISKSEDIRKPIRWQCPRHSLVLNVYCMFVVQLQEQATIRAPPAGAAGRRDPS
jgi:hypothetical protein